MSELWFASLRFPTVVFTIALGIALVYWLFVLLGALDIDLFGGEHADVGGHDVDVDVGGHDVDADVDGDLDADGAGLWHTLGLGSVPLTISISTIVLVAYVTCLLVMHYVVADSGIGWLPPVLLPATLLFAMPVSGVLVRPLAPIFEVHEGRSRHQYIGHVCTVLTGPVDDKFGDATIEDGGTRLIVQVRSDSKGTLERGDKALIIEFDNERQAYLVVPAADAAAG
jgi:hypothetical protein